ncbi:MAG: MFS transporter [Pseudomonadota bacterium]
MTAAAIPGAAVARKDDRLGAFALFAAMLSAAGLPIYIHAPKFYVDNFGVGLTTSALVLFGLRLLDVLQDPALGWLSERLGRRRGLAVACGAALMALAMVGLFAVTPPIAPLAWFALTLALLFSGFSFLTINFYAQGVAKADSLGPTGHTRVAGWRETGALLGICAAAVAPTALAGLGGGAFAVFAVGFAVLVVIASWAMREEWSASLEAPAAGIGPILRDALARRLLWIALANATPVAVSSTLFLYFVESRLGLPGWEGVYLLAFFLAAALSAPIWSWLAARFSPKPVLLTGMVLAILSFGGAATLGTGDALAFAVICLASGAALGADMTLLPAIFAGRMAQIAPRAAQGFGLWSFVSKFTLAFAAVLLLPVLEASGFQSGGTDNPASALTTLTILYALLPCALKLIAIALLIATPIKES